METADPFGYDSGAWRKAGGVPASVWKNYGFVIDATFWPVLVQRMPVAFPSDNAAIDAWIEHVDSLARERATKFVMIVDALETRTAADAQVRKRVGDWMSNSVPYRTQCLGAVTIVASAVVRGGLTALNWLTRPDPPRVVVSSWADALAESRTLLRRVSIELPAGLEARKANTR